MQCVEWSGSVVKLILTVPSDDSLCGAADQSHRRISLSASDWLNLIDSFFSLNGGYLTDVCWRQASVKMDAPGLKLSKD